MLWRLRGHGGARLRAGRGLVAAGPGPPSPRGPSETPPGRVRTAGQWGPRRPGGPSRGPRTAVVRPDLRAAGAPPEGVRGRGGGFRGRGEASPPRDGGVRASPGPVGALRGMCFGGRRARTRFGGWRARRRFGGRRARTCLGGLRARTRVGGRTARTRFGGRTDRWMEEDKSLRGGCPSMVQGG